MYRVILDCETLGDVNDHSTLKIYDLGYQIVDGKGNVVVARRYVVDDVYYGMRDEMKTAYYAKKLPAYNQAIANGTLEVRKWLNIVEEFAELCKAYKVKYVYAYNAGFDRDATNNTTRVLSNGFKKYFTPYGVKWRCIQAMAGETLCNSKNYFKFAYENGFTSPSGNVRTTAEAVYAYLINDPTYKEEHTALEDVKIETAILFRILKRHQKNDPTPSRVAWRKPQKKFQEWVAKNVK